MRRKMKKMNIREICAEVDKIISGKNDSEDYKLIYQNLREVSSQEVQSEEIELVCETLVKIAPIKNRILRYVEKDIWHFIQDIPFHVAVSKEIEFTEGEELLPNSDYEQEGKRILSRLVGFAMEILSLKEDKSKGNEIRRAGSLHILTECMGFYDIPNAKKIFVDSIKSKNTDEQFQALLGLERYYEVEGKELEDDLLATIESIFEETEEESIASTCLQIQINAGIINEDLALDLKDEWEDKNYY